MDIKAIGPDCKGDLAKTLIDLQAEVSKLAGLGLDVVALVCLRARWTRVSARLRREKLGRTAIGATVGMGGRQGGESLYTAYVWRGCSGLGAF